MGCPDTHSEKNNKPGKTDWVSSSRYLLASLALLSNTAIYHNNFQFQFFLTKLALKTTKKNESHDSFFSFLIITLCSLPLRTPLLRVRVHTNEFFQRQLPLRPLLGSTPLLSVCAECPRNFRGTSLHGQILGQFFC